MVEIVQKIRRSFIRPFRFELKRVIWSNVSSFIMCKVNECIVYSEPYHAQAFSLHFEFSWRHLSSLYQQGTILRAKLNASKLPTHFARHKNSGQIFIEYSRSFFHRSEFSLYDVRVCLLYNKLFAVNKMFIKLSIFDA